MGMTGADPSATLGMTKPEAFIKHMFKKIILVSVFSALLGGSSFVLAQSFGIDEAADKAGIGRGSGIALSQKTVPEVIGDIVGVVLSLLGVLFFLLILYAGIMWMTAFGASDKVEKAKDILIHAAVGLVIVLSAYAISQFVFSRLGAGGGGATPTGITPAVGAITGQTCGDGDNKVWNASGECVTECKFNYLTTADCLAVDACMGMGIPEERIKDGLCPGDETIKCCVLIE